MPKRSPVLRRIALAYAAAAFVAVLEAIALDFEIFGATLLLSLATLPSIALYALYTHYDRAFPRIWRAFVIPGLVIPAFCLYGQFVRSPEVDVPALARGVLLCYLLQMAPAYFVLNASPPRHSA
jgi:hypothetical protein